MLDNSSSPLNSVDARNKSRDDEAGSREQLRIIPAVPQAASANT
jgi:hypothetical protein